MSKRISSMGVMGVLALSFFVFPSVADAAQYYLQYPGIGFMPKDKVATYTKHHDGFIYHNDLTDESYLCPITFNVPEGSTHFIKSLGIRYKDNLTDGYIYIKLLRRNLFSGAIHAVASWQSPGASVSHRTASQGTETGKKLLDTKKFSYWLYVYFYKDGDANPGVELILYQVRIHHGT